MASEYVLFALLPLKDSAFIQNLSSFGTWFFWNECAITQHPHTKEWKLLQTIPGLEFHHVAQRTRYMGDAQKHFSQIMDRLRFGSPKKLHEILGLEDPLKYEQLVNVIPWQQLVSVNPDPIDEGKRGIVYKAVWKCPQMSDMPGPEEVTVVLKAMKASDPNYLKRFFQELDASLALLRRANIGGMRFFGVMKTPSLSVNDSQSTSDSLFYKNIARLPKDTLFLVSKYATEGNLFQHLTNTLTGIMEDWKLLVYLMMCVAVNISKYHQANIVHRDISVSNVLVDKESQKSSGPGGIIVKVSDLGESIQLEGPMAKFPYCGDQQSSALGASPYGQISKAADIYSFRNLLALMVRKMWEVSKQKQGVEDHRVPKCIVECLEWCRKTEELRMSDLASELDKALWNVEDLTSQMEKVDPGSLDDIMSETES
ncbi:hypothetical protein N7G274_010165 [Stereocaulon virgatum]|uniref:EKC/KEOPS complex subunit BUD32 n=1 Tax=Stereocaulon virgatum TaxID=373712 RepID=A0ABR3ZWB8_9LECA